MIDHFLLFQLKVHTMLNTLIYQQLLPTCFGVCYTIFRETIILLVQKLRAFCNFAIKYTTYSDFFFLIYNLQTFFVVLRPNSGNGLLILEVSRSHTTTHHSR